MGRVEVLDDYEGKAARIGDATQELFDRFEPARRGTDGDDQRRSVRRQPRIRCAWPAARSAPRRSLPRLSSSHPLPRGLGQP